MAAGPESQDVQSAEIEKVDVAAAERQVAASAIRGAHWP